MSEMQVGREMPRYKCHKIVHALKIAKLEPTPRPDNEESDGSMICTPAEEGYAPFNLDREYMRKHKPVVGGYYVVYSPDGYSSFSPQQAFEEGYTLIA